MKTIHEFLIEKGIKSNLDPVNIPQVKKWMKEYSDYLLEQAAEKSKYFIKRSIF